MTGTIRLVEGTVILVADWSGGEIKGKAMG